jgi:outer membrane protein assembly factor BamB
MTGTRLALALGLALAGPAPAADWPHWRGPTRDGLTPEQSGWDGSRWVGEKPDWSAAVGEGGGGPLVIGDTVLVFGHADGHDILRGLNTKDGKERWSVKDKAPRHPRFHEGDENLYSGPSATPEFDPDTGLVYTLGSDGDLRCRDTRAEGKQVWHRNLYDEYKVPKRPRLTSAPRRDYGYTTSPFVRRDWLLIEVGSTTRGTLAAFDKKTGKEVWWSEIKDEGGHTGGPSAMTVGGVTCLAVLTQRNLAVVRLDAGHEGKTLATFPWVTDFANTIAGPAVHGDSVLLAAGYNHNAMVRVRVGLKGTEEVWRVKYPSKVCTPVVHEGRVYVAWQRVRCLDWETGQLRWQGGTIGDPGSCVVTADGRLIVYGLSGKLLLVEGAGRSPAEYRELAVRDKLFRSEAWPHVAVAGGRVFCRDRSGTLAAFSLK